MEMPTSPPQLRVPMTGPIFSTWNSWGSSSPPEPACRLVRHTRWAWVQTAGVAVSLE